MVHHTGFMSFLVSFPLKLAWGNPVCTVDGGNFWVPGVRNNADPVGILGYAFCQIRWLLACEDVRHSRKMTGLLCREPRGTSKL